MTLNTEYDIKEKCKKMAIKEQENANKCYTIMAIHL